MTSTIYAGQKRCRRCKEWKPTSMFGFFLNKPNHIGEQKRYINSRCKKCASEVTSEWQRENRPAIYAKWKKSKEDMLEVIRNHYGGKCSCCGEKNPMFLTIDHINNDGYKLRPRNKNGEHHPLEFSGHYYARIIKAGFPKDLQLLCWNCNSGRARNGGICPHKT